MRSDYDQRLQELSKEIQILKGDILDREQLLEKERDRRHDLERTINVKQTDIDQVVKELTLKQMEIETENERLNDRVKACLVQIENERKNHIEVLAVVEDRWEQKVKALEMQIEET